MNLDTLNEQQKEAVTTVNGPLLVLAGAGSGKTRVLTTRVAYLLEEVGIAPEQILAITFTNKAAKEMKERIIQMLGPIGYQIQISTFHSFGLLILRENYEKLNYAKNFTILDSDDTLTVIKKIMKDMGLDPKEYNPRAIKNRISGAKNELLSPMEYERFAQTDFEEKVVKIYEKYEQKLKQNDSVDFDDLLMLPIQLFQKFPEILKSYQERFQYILVDEYQDTNEAQYILIKMISAKYRNICVVGDNDQSIYSFRGANYRNILNFEKDYKNPKVIMLEENYRSTKTILNAANDVIQNNKQRKDKNLWSNNEEGELIKYIRTDGEKEEADYVAKEIKKLIAGKIVVFAGQSGAGKSSLLNKLDKTLNLETNEISKALGRGKHTTRCTTLYDIDNSLIADTPGFSSVDFRGMTKIDIRDNMKDMFDNLHNCKYKDCMHIKEDDCEVKRLVEQNKILLSRYNNYKSFIGGQK